MVRILANALAVAVLACILSAPAVAQESTASPESATADQQRFADGLLSRGLYDMAIEEYRRILSDDPAYVKLDEVLFRLGEAYRKLKQGPAAERMYLRVVREFPDSAYRDRAAFRRGELYVRSGKYLEAVNLMRALLESDPEPDIAASASYYAGYSMKRIALTGEAQLQFTKIIEKYPDSEYRPFAALELAGMYRQNDSTRPKAAKLYTLISESDTSDRMKAESLFQLGDLHYGEGDYTAAVAAYTDLRTRFPGDSRVPEGVLQVGWSLFRTDQWKALGALCAETGRTESIWRYFAANVLRAEKDYAGAMDGYRVFLTREPDHRLSPSARYEEALCAFALKDYRRAVVRLREGHWEAPLVTDRTWLLAQAEMRLNNSPAAVKELEAFLALESDSDRAAAVKFELARFAQADGRLEEAAGQYRALQAAHDNHTLAPKAFYAAGFCMAARDDFNQAIKDWNLLIRTYPESDQVAPALLQKGLAQIRLERFPSAEDTLKEYLKTKPSEEEEIEALYWLGQVHEETSDFEKARTVYQSALDKAAGHSRESALRFRLAGVAQSLGDTESAAALYQDVLDSPEAKNMPPSLMEWLVRQNLDRGDGGKAVQAAKAMIAGNHDGSWNQIAYFLLGKAQALNGDAASSIKAYATAFELPARTPEGVQAGLELGAMLLEQGTHAEASRVLAEVVEKSREDGQLPQRAKATFLLGRTAEKAGDVKAAARYYMSVAILYDDPDLSPEALYRAAAAYAAGGSEKEQRSALKELSSRYPDSSWAKKVE